MSSNCLAGFVIEMQKKKKSRMRIVDGRLKNRSGIPVHAKFVSTIVTTVINWAVICM